MGFALMYFWAAITVGCLTLIAEEGKEYQFSRAERIVWSLLWPVFGAIVVWTILCED